jgi:hypothetical protein
VAPGGEFDPLTVEVPAGGKVKRLDKHPLNVADEAFGAGSEFGAHGGYLGRDLGH